MDITGAYTLQTTRDVVWAALNDPEILRQCIPGCKELEQTSPEDLTAKVSLKIGPVSATFAGAVKLDTSEAPDRCTITGQGNGGIAGFAKGSATVTLVEEGDSTQLSYTAKAEIGGKIAALGSRLIQGTSRKLADEFFARFAGILGVKEIPANALTEDSASTA
jgi:carbon monoxide dehydrogenase subunit G